ncbi:MAG: Mth938-like domain-containing protein [Nitrospiraceae bacterium]|nr:Mth938-like domain-containing protein [Nitrospiraceae bacterium]
MHIDDYAFGRIVINGSSYTSDVIVYPDRVDSPWWRKEGHLLQKADLKDIIAAAPEILVIGTGFSGVMKVPDQTVNFLKSKGITVFIEKTGKAVELFNEKRSGGKVIGAFHLTC